MLFPDATSLQMQCAAYCVPADAFVAIDYVLGPESFTLGLLPAHCGEAKRNKTS